MALHTLNFDKIRKNSNDNKNNDDNNNNNNAINN